jgi:hypothetical protein
MRGSGSGSDSSDNGRKEAEAEAEAEALRGLSQSLWQLQRAGELCDVRVMLDDCSSECCHAGEGEGG